MKTYSKTLIIIILLLMFVIPVYSVCSDLYTISASNVTSGSADLRMVLNVSQDVWFEYGIVSGDYNLKTWETPKTSGNVSETIKGSYMSPGQKYYFRASCNNCSGDEFNFTLSSATPVPTTTFSIYVTEIVDSEWNITEMLPIIGGPYEDAFSSLGVPPMFFYALIWLFIFIALWIRQENMLLPVMLFIIMMPIIAFSGFLPGNWIFTSYLVIVLSIAALIYYVFRSR